MTDDEAETYGTHVGNRDDEPDVWIPVAVAKELGFEIGDRGTIVVRDGRATIIPDGAEAEDGGVGHSHGAAGDD